jgi:ATP-dependent helicase/nuclease subunit A
LLFFSIFLSEITAFNPFLLPKLPTDFGNDKLIPLYISLPRIFSHYNNPGDPKQLVSILKLFNQSGKIVQKKWVESGNFTKEDAKEEQTRWDDFRENTVKPVLNRWLECCYSPVMKVLFSARKIYNQMRQESGVLNFQDLLMKSADLLKDNPEVRLYFKKRFTHLLIDEFQDTDPIQAKVMMYLMATDVKETSWRKCVPSPGSLFVVGDPKQSIYRFRRADIVTYKEVKEIIRKGGGQIINLSTNFRTSGSIFDWVNSLFGPDVEDTEESLKTMLHFPKAETDESPAYVAIKIGRYVEEKCQLSGLHRLTVPDEYTNIESIIPYEADRIARTIRNAIDSKMTIARTAKEIESGASENVREDDFMIITRNKKFLSIYARKLQEYGIPNKVTGGSSLNEVEELRQLYLCLLTLHYPDDPVYLVGLLRSGMFGINDRCLYRYKKAGGRFNYNSDITKTLSDEDTNLFADIFDQLKKYSQWLSMFPVITAVEKIIDDSGLMLSAAIRQGGEIEAGGLAKGIEILRTMQKGLYLHQIKF